MNEVVYGEKYVNHKYKKSKLILISWNKNEKTQEHYIVHYFWKYRVFFPCLNFVESIQIH